MEDTHIAPRCGLPRGSARVAVFLPPRYTRGCARGRPCGPRHCGEVAEWLNAAVSKTVRRVTPVSRVRIPPSPPETLATTPAPRSRGAGASCSWRGRVRVLGAYCVDGNARAVWGRGSCSLNPRCGWRGGRPSERSLPIQCGSGCPAGQTWHAPEPDEWHPHISTGALHADTPDVELNVGKMAEVAETVMCAMSTKLAS
jgi:hypothetical protein